MENRRVLAVLDRIVHRSTTPLDREQSFAGLVRLLDGKMPSEVLGKVKGQAVHKGEIEQLKQKLRDAEVALADIDQSKQQELRVLIEEVAKLQARLNDHQSSHCESRDSYTRAQIKQIIATMFPKDHGVGKALVQKNAEQRKRGVQVHKITDSLLQKWQRDNCYPNWFVEQLKLLHPDDLLRTHRWQHEEKEFVKTLWLANPQQSNEQLAEACSKQFGCKITDSSIRGVLHRAGLLRPHSTDRS